MSAARWWIRANRPDPGLPVVQVDDFLVPQRFEATVVRNDERIDFTQDELSSDWPTVTLQIEIQAGRPVIRQLTIASPQATGIQPAEEKSATDSATEQLSIPGGHPISASLLRDLPLGQLAKYAMLGVAVRRGQVPSSQSVVPDEIRDGSGFYRIGPDEFVNNYGIRIIDTPDLFWSEQMQTLAAFADQAARPPHRNRVSDELLQDVVQIYRQALNTGRPPKKAVQAALNVSQTAAGRYIMRARQQGHLGKTVPGKKGELT
jgi:hypothetical protein